MNKLEDYANEYKTFKSKLLYTDVFRFIPLVMIVIGYYKYGSQILFYILFASCLLLNFDIILKR